MSNLIKSLARVEKSALELASCLETPSNVPLEDYIDVDTAYSLAEAMAIEPQSITDGDLERILILRESLSIIIENVNTLDEELDFSIDQLLNLINKLYVDVEQLLRLGSDNTVLKAKSNYETHKATQIQEIEARGTISREVERQVTELVATGRITRTEINLSIVDIKLGDINLIKNLELNVKRLSASAIAIKLQFKAGVIYEGTIKFLNNAADNVISDLKQIIQKIKGYISSSEKLFEILDNLIVTGGRFTSFISKLIQTLFDEKIDTDNADQYFFRLIKKYRGPNFVCCTEAHGEIAAAGPSDGFFTYNHNSAIVTKHEFRFNVRVSAISPLEHDRFAIGTHEGLYLTTSQRRLIQSNYNERVNAVVVMPWGGLRQTIITGSSDGALRKWTLAGGLTQYRENTKSRDVVNKLGSKIQSIIPWKENIVVATNDKVFVLDEKFEILSKIPINSRINGMCSFNDDAVIVVGNALIAHVNLSRGVYARVLSVSDDTNYVAATQLEQSHLCAATADGRLHVIDMNSSAEVGGYDLEMDVYDITRIDDSIFACGKARDRYTMKQLDWRVGKEQLQEI